MKSEKFKQLRVWQNLPSVVFVIKVSTAIFVTLQQLIMMGAKNKEHISRT